jgi:hypothetical protein
VTGRAMRLLSSCSAAEAGAMANSILSPFRQQHGCYSVRGGSSEDAPVSMRCSAPHRPRVAVIRS